MHDLTAARKNARTDEDAAAIAWAQDRIAELERDLAEQKEECKALWDRNVTLSQLLSEQPPKR